MNNNEDYGIVENSIMDRLGWRSEDASGTVLRWNHNDPVGTIMLESNAVEPDDDIDSQEDFDECLFGDVDVSKDVLSDQDWAELLAVLEFGNDDFLIDRN